MSNRRSIVKLFTLILIIFTLWQCYTQKKIDIYLIGDSTMAEYDSSRHPLTGWGEMLQPLFNENVTVHNYAVSGKSSKSFRDLGYWKTVIDSIKKGDYLFIQFGHNDEKEYDSTRYTVPGGTFNENLKNYVTEAREKGAIPILLTPIRRRKFDEKGNLLDTHGKYPDAVRTVAKEMNVPLIDLQKMTKPLIEKYGVEGSKKLFMWIKPGEYPGYPEGDKDNTHLTELGAKEISKLVAVRIKELGIGLGNYVVVSK